MNLIKFIGTLPECRERTVLLNSIKGLYDYRTSESPPKVLELNFCENMRTVDWLKIRFFLWRAPKVGQKTLLWLQGHLIKNGFKINLISGPVHKHYPLDAANRNGRITAVCRDCDKTLVVSSWRIQRGKPL